LILPSFKVLRSGKNKAPPVLGFTSAPEEERGQGTTLLVGSGWPGAPGDSGARDKTDRRACNGSPFTVTGWSGLSVRTPAGLAELTSTCPATHAGWVDG
jgi:hypothetical protein